MTALFVLILLVAMPASALLAGERPEPTPEPWTLGFIRDHLDVDAGDLGKLRKGGAVIDMIRDRGGREIAVRGIAAVPGSVLWTSDFAGIEKMRRSSPDLISMGPFSSPPSLEQFAGAVLDPAAFPLIPKCLPMQCTLNLPAEPIESLARAAQGEGDSAAEANGAFRQFLVATARSYQEKGDAALPVLANRKRTVTTADAPALLLAHRPSLADLAPALDAHFRACPPAGEACASDVYYWYREKSWKYEVVGLAQAAFDEREVEGGHIRVWAEKTFYADHYFRSALTITGVLEDPSGSYVFFVTRNETDNGSNFNFIERALAGYLLPRRMQSRLAELRGSLGAGTRPREASGKD